MKEVVEEEAEKMENFEPEGSPAVNISATERNYLWSPCLIINPVSLVVMFFRLFVGRSFD